MVRSFPATIFLPSLVDVLRTTFFPTLETVLDAVLRTGLLVRVEDFLVTLLELFLVRVLRFLGRPNN